MSTPSGPPPGPSGPPPGPGRAAGPPPAAPTPAGPPPGPGRAGGPPSGPPPAGPPAGPPSGPAVAGPPSGPDRTAARRAAPGALAALLRRPQAIAAVVALLGGGGFLATRGDDGASSAPPPTVQVGGEVLREPVTVAGPDPFTQPVSYSTTTAAGATTTALATTTAPATTAPAASTTTTGPVSLAATSGATPGLYGGTLDNSSCDREKLVAFLEQTPDKAAAWAEVQGIQPSEIRTFVAGLTPVLLQADTRVTNHGFSAGRATPRQAVLQAGTAVLVDRLGEPRVRCACGNPLRALVPQAQATSFTGPSWPAFDPTNLQAVTPAPKPLDVFTLVDTASGRGIARPAGTDGAKDTPAPAPPPLPQPRDRGTTTTAAPTTAPSGPTTTRAAATTTTVRTSTTPPPPTTRAANIPAPNAFVQKDGTVAASSTDPAYPVALAVDGNPATSWFSRGSNVDGPVTQFTWVGARDDLITNVRIVSNAGHAVPEFRRNYGYEKVVVQVLDAQGAVDFEETVFLPGTPDPDITVRPGVRGRSVRLSFSGGEAPDCGGFAELEIGVTR